MFKAGEKVICVSAPTGSGLVIGKEYIVKLADHKYVRIYGGSIEGPWNIDRFKPVSIIEEAEKLLRQKGYTITPPPEPRKGTVFVVQNTTTKRIIPFSEGIWETFDIEYKQQYKILAIVPWTEGDGLEV